MNKYLLFAVLIFSALFSWSQNYAPAAGENGSTAINMLDNSFIDWASGITVSRGYVHIEDTTFESNGTNRATFGSPSNALGQATGQAGDVVSLGDHGIAVLTFDSPITNGIGYDFAVFENSFDDTFLEFAHVEVSSDGVNYVRFPSHSEVQSEVQIHGFGSTDPRRIYNLAGKYKGGYGTPFDLEEIKDSSTIDVSEITHIKIIDVVGSIGDSATFDSYGNKINEPFPTPYESGGFDLEAVGVINSIASTKEALIQDISFYPNPTAGPLNIEASEPIDLIEIFNSLGEKVFESSKVKTINLSLKKGTYFLKIHTKSTVINDKLLIK